MNLLRPAFLALLLAPALALAKPYVIKADGTKLEGDVITGSADGTISLTTAQGKFDFKPGQYKEAFADKPADFDTANAAALAKDYAKADEFYQKVIRQYPNLNWDIQAGIRCIHMYVQKGDGAAAEKAADFITSRNKTALSKSPDLQWMVWKALVLNKNFAKVELEAKKAIAEGSHELAARAYMARGDASAAKSLHKEAVLDYLRVVLICEAQKEVQPEALFKAATALENLKDGARAKEMYGRLTKDFPNSPYAAQAKGKD